MITSIFILEGVDDRTIFVLAIACALSAILLIALTIHRGRARGRDRCPRCWYTLTTNPAHTLPRTCPECGRIITKPRQLRKVHWFRWPLILAAILLLLAPYLAALPNARTNGWLSFAPNWALRAWVRTMPAESSYSPVNRLLNNFTAASESERARIADAIAPALLRYRPRWPKDIPVAISQDPSFAGLVTLVLASPPSPPSPPTLWLTFPPTSSLQSTFAPPSFASAERFWTESEVGLTTPIQLQGRTVVPVSVLSRATIDSKTSKSAPIITHTVHLPIQLVGSIDDVITPVQSAEIDALIRDHLSPRFFRSHFSERIAIQFRGWKRDDALNTLAIGIHIQVLRQGTVVATARWRDDNNAAGMLLPVPVELQGDEQQLSALLRASPSDPSWIIRVSADPEMALHDLRSDKYWSGRFDMPLSEFFSRRVSTP